MIACLLAPLLSARNAADPAAGTTLRSPIPLGTDTLRLVPAKRLVYLLASAEVPALDGVREVGEGGSRVLISADGVPLEQFPQVITFRVTASARPEELLESRPFSVAYECDLNQYLLGLKFRLKIFNGLHVTVLEPEAVRQIGVPADLPYDERIYRVSFRLNEVPLQHRMFLEVLSPAGERISKFHLDLM
jgi:hypothetical protein